MDNKLKAFLFAFIFIMLCASSMARGSMLAAFEYKKSKTRVRKEKKELPSWRRLLCWYQPEHTKVPWHMQRFRRFRILYWISFCCATIVFLLFDKLPLVVTCLVVIPGIVAWVVDCTYYFAVLRRSAGDKRITFERAKRQ